MSDGNVVTVGEHTQTSYTTHDFEFSEQKSLIGFHGISSQDRQLTNFGVIVLDMECNQVDVIIRAPVAGMDPTFKVIIIVCCLLVALIILCFVVAYLCQAKQVKKEQVKPHEFIENERKDTENPDIDHQGTGGHE